MHLTDCRKKLGVGVLSSGFKCELQHLLTMKNKQNKLFSFLEPQVPQFCKLVIKTYMLSKVMVKIRCLNTCISIFQNITLLLLLSSNIFFVLHALWF